MCCNELSARDAELNRTIVSLSATTRDLEEDNAQLAYECGVERQNHEKQRRREAERIAELTNQVVHLQAKLYRMTTRMPPEDGKLDVSGGSATAFTTGITNTTLNSTSSTVQQEETGVAARFEPLSPALAVNTNYVSLLKERLSDRRIEYAPFYSDLEYVFDAPVNQRHECTLRMCGESFASGLCRSRTNAKQTAAQRAWDWLQEEMHRYYCPSQPNTGTENTQAAVSENGTVPDSEFQEKTDSENEEDTGSRPGSPSHNRVQTEVRRQRTPSPSMMQPGTVAPPTQLNGQLNDPLGMRPDTEFAVGQSEPSSQLEATVRTVCSIGLVSMVESVEDNSPDSPPVLHRRAWYDQVCLEPIAHTVLRSIGLGGMSWALAWQKIHEVLEEHREMLQTYLDNLIEDGVGSDDQLRTLSKRMEVKWICEIACCSDSEEMKNVAFGLDVQRTRFGPDVPIPKLLERACKTGRYESNDDLNVEIERLAGLVRTVEIHPDRGLVRTVEVHPDRKSDGCERSETEEYCEERIT